MTPFLFQMYDRVLHVKTGRVFLIVGTPDRCRIESGWVPAYVYREEGGGFVVRPQSEMEDGRFVPTKSAAYPCPMTDANGNKVFALSPEIHVLASDVEKGS